MIYPIAILVTAVLFTVLILLLAVKPNISKKITMSALAISGISGLLIYGYGYMVITDNFVLAVLKALLAVCGSFVGRNEYDNLSAVPIMQTEWMQIFCTFVQICALYTTASAIITSLGTEALKKLRLWLARRGQLHIIYGINNDTLEFGKELIGQKNGAVVFVAKHPSPTESAAVSSMGCVLQTSVHALNADRKFLRGIGFRGSKRHLNLYAIDRNFENNISYAKSLLETLHSYPIPTEQLHLVVLGNEDAIRKLQHTPERYGYGYVTAVNEARLSARLLTLQYPPCETISFDSNGMATENFEALLIGFGRVGQEVLKSLVMNGQFTGSHFRLSVFATDYNQNSGLFEYQFKSLCKEYDISFYNQDARSRHMYEYLINHISTLKYAVICTGNETLNREIAEELLSYCNHAGCCVPVFQCSHAGVVAYACDGTIKSSHTLYTTRVLCSDRLDRMAMILNHRYQTASDKTAVQNWINCDYFSRQSCRASADFVSAMLRAAGKTAQQVLDGDWHLTEAQKENLSITEHLRWCAFHYCMGFSAMTDEEFDSRASLYLKQVEQNGTSAVRINKNMINYTHACLIPWEELDRLSEKEAAVTGKQVDYKAMDTKNILAIPDLLQAASV